jgi:hypothetical protein
MKLKAARRELRATSVLRLALSLRREDEDEGEPLFRRTERGRAEADPR